MHPCDSWCSTTDDCTLHPHPPMAARSDAGSRAYFDTGWIRVQNSPHDEPSRQIKGIVAISDVYFFNRSPPALHIDNEHEPPCATMAISCQRLLLLLPPLLPLLPVVERQPFLSALLVDLLFVDLNAAILVLLPAAQFSIKTSPVSLR